LWKSNNIHVERNRIEGHRDGIYLEFVNHSYVGNNISARNLRYGLHFMFSHHDEYRGNTFSDNGSGVAVMYSNHIRMVANSFRKSLGPSSYGILLKDIAAAEIRENEFHENTIGAYLEGTTRSAFSRNRFSRNGWAVRILGDCDGIVFSQNNFQANTFDISTNASRSLNTFSGNYWSRHRGLDLNRDGTGDQPYYPVQFSTLLMSRYGASVLLIRSFFFTVLDEMEALIPALTPASFRDDHPRMRPVTL
jgi:nitrous oxidase accessory protein